MHSKSLLFLALVSIIFSSCEGFKSLTISNKTNENTYFVVEKIAQEYYHKLYSQKTIPEKTFDTHTITIAPNSESLVAVTSIVPMMFSNKLIAPDLTIKKIYIAQGADTIKFENEQEIIDALKGKEFKTNTFSIQTKRKNNSIIIK